VPISAQTATEADMCHGSTREGTGSILWSGSVRGHGKRVSWRIEGRRGPASASRKRQNVRGGAVALDVEPGGTSLIAVVGRYLGKLG